jgi:hypothetical protein
VHRPNQRRLPCLSTLYRNIIKERALVRERDVLCVMVKGGDWAFGAQLIDGALLAMDTPAKDMPARIFTPMVLSGSGAKLSKCLRRAALDTPPDAVHHQLAWLAPSTNTPTPCCGWSTGFSPTRNTSSDPSPPAN